MKYISLSRFADRTKQLPRNRIFAQPIGGRHSVASWGNDLPESSARRTPLHQLRKGFDDPPSRPAEYWSGFFFSAKSPRYESPSCWDKDFFLLRVVDFWVYAPGGLLTMHFSFSARFLAAKMVSGQSEPIESLKMESIRIGCEFVHWKRIPNHRIFRNGRRHLFLLDKQKYL